MVKELSEDAKADVAMALRAVKAKKVGSSLGLNFVCHKPKHVVFNDASEHPDGLKHEVQIPHWLVDRLHKNLK